MQEQLLQNRSLQFVNWGLVPYSEKMQTDLVDAIASGEEPQTIVFCMHPPIVTLGRKADRTADITGWDGEVVEVRRGGRATYHGPSQLVVYPLIDLRQPQKNFGVHDVIGLIRYLENAVVELLAHYGLVGVPGHKKSGDSLALGKPDSNSNEKHELMTGVWVNNKKICSLGIAVSKWISFHGIALNVEPDSKAFKGINPCGFSSDTMTDLISEIKKIDPDVILQPQELRAAILQQLKSGFLNSF